ncbi:hypothetical protein FHG64_02695 [Antarcticibacterium flavum]|uniref:Porin n=1 Tax=Antarcticibacterium flavum TaxID=2058175 RepID=A0A5B7WYX8_9FLAO|nr:MULTISPECIES: porin [Antarcticibacterium]MCM4161822.1 hypothetical protein [Antarcticibacterium sp. W02-3]QCY68386.1 hypothetical protein FHG64_02695 [Antarcticibacterium flavum]
MIRSFVLVVLLFFPLLFFPQVNDSLREPIFPVEKMKLLENINFTFDMRMGFQAYTFRGGDNYYNGIQFQNGFTALGISGKLHERVNFTFRNRFNKNSEVQTLDRLGNDIELAYIDLEVSPTVNVLLGKMIAFYGGYEYEFSPLYVLEYNDVYNNVLAFVTGAGITYQVFENHKFGLQVLNSRTMHYDDLYGDIVAENIQEPDWPVAFVGNWRGNFFGGKLQTIYSLSHSNEVKRRGTTFFTLGHKYQDRDFTLMYDFHYSFEQVDTKRVMTALLGDGSIAENVLYIENWLRAEYSFSPRFQGLLTLMTSSAYLEVEDSQKHMRRSYGMIPTIYYSPFKNFNFKFFLAYIGRYFDHSNYAIENFAASNYNKNEVRIGFIAPFLLF